MKPISPHVLRQVRDVMIQHFGQPPWDQAHALFADDMTRTLQATNDVAEAQEARAQLAEAKARRFVGEINKIGQVVADAIQETSKP